MNPFSTSAIRREFPRDRLPDIMTKAGNVSLVAVKAHLSARGTPTASAKLVASLIKDGGLHPVTALAMAGLAENVRDLAVCTWQERVAGLTWALKRRHAEKWPNGKYAHELGIACVEVG